MFPDALHRTLKARAAMAGVSLSDYLLAEVREIAKRPTLIELQRRLERCRPVNFAGASGGKWYAAGVTRSDRCRRLPAITALVVKLL